MNHTTEVIEQDQSSYWPEFIFGFGADEDEEEGADDSE